MTEANDPAVMRREETADGTADATRGDTPAGAGGPDRPATPAAPATAPRLTVVGIFPWSRFWAIGEGQGSPSFFLSPRGFVEAGHRMIIVMPRGPEPPGGSVYHGIEVVRYRGGPATIVEDPRQGRLVRFILRNTSYWQYLLASLLAGWRVCRREKPDALIAYGDYSVPSTWLLGWMFAVPTVNRLFGTFLDRFLHNPFRLLYHYIQVVSLKIPARYVVFVDDGSRGDVVARRFGVPESRLRFWRNGVNHAIYDPGADPARLRRKLKLPPAGALLFTISRLGPEKHVERIIRALPCVLERHPDARLVIIGEGPARRALDAEAKRLRVEHAVIWAGSVDQDHLGEYIMAGDVFVAMSDRTNAANPLFEAMICGRPGVVLDTGATSRVIDDGVNGWLVPEAEPEALGPLLARLLGEPSCLRETGARAREWALKHVPTWSERQRMEVEIVERAVAEARAESRRKDRARS